MNIYGLLLVSIAALSVNSAVTPNTSGSLEDSQPIGSNSASSRAADVPKSAELTKQMLCAVNAIRKKHGKTDLKLDDRLMRSAQLHSEDQASRMVMSHEGSDGSSLSERANRQGYPSSGLRENVASSQKTITDVIKNWNNSASHLENIISDLKCFGWGEKDSYWTQNFASDGECQSAQIVNC